MSKVDTGDIYAMKVLRKPFLIKTDSVQGTKTERDILRQVRHPFIVSLHYAFQTKGKVLWLTVFDSFLTSLSVCSSLLFHSFCSFLPLSSCFIFLFFPCLKVYLVMDYMNGGQLFTHLREESMFSESLVRFYAGTLYPHASNYPSFLCCSIS